MLWIVHVSVCCDLFEPYKSIDLNIYNLYQICYLMQSDRIQNVWKTKQVANASEKMRKRDFSQDPIL